MKVTIDELRASPQRRLGLTFKENLEGTEAVKPVVGELVASVDVCGVRLSGWVKTLLKLSCHRCLRPYFQNLDIELDERFVHDSGQEVPPQRELNRGDFVEPIPANGVLDISDVVYQAVTLATPTYCLCGEECPGPPIQPESDSKEGGAPADQAAKPVDPRWENLKTLFAKEETG